MFWIIAIVVVVGIIYFAAKYEKEEKQTNETLFDNYSNELDDIALVEINSLMKTFETQYSIRRKWSEGLSASGSYEIQRGVWDHEANNSNGTVIRYDSHEPMFRFVSGPYINKILKKLPLISESNDEYFWKACEPYFEKRLNEEAKKFFLPSDIYSVHVSASSKSLYVGISAQPSNN